MIQILEFFGVFVGNKQKIRTLAFRHTHGTRDGTNARADCGQEAGAQTISDFVQVLELLVLGSFVVILVGDRGVDVGVDFFGGEWLRHGDASFCTAVNGEDLGLINIVWGLRTECRGEEGEELLQRKRTYVRFTFTSLKTTEGVGNVMM